MSSRPHRALVIALYLNAALLAAIAVALFSGRNSSWLPAAYGAPLSPQPIAGSANLYLMPAQFTQQTWGCYVMDTDAQTLCAYRYLPTGDGANLRLVAARRIAYDHKLSNFNSDKPSWNEVREWIEKGEEPIRGVEDSAPKTPDDKTLDNKTHNGGSRNTRGSDTQESR